MIFRRLPEKIWQASTSRIKRSLRGARIQSSTARQVRDSNWQSEARHDLLLSLSDLCRLSATEGRHAAAGVRVKHGSRHGFLFRRRQEHVCGGVMFGGGPEIEYVIGGPGTATRTEHAGCGLIISR